MFKSITARVVALRILAYLAVGIAVGALIVYSPAIEFVPSFVMDAVGIAYFGALALTFFVALPVALVLGTIDHFTRRKPSGDGLPTGREHG